MVAISRAILYHLFSSTLFISKALLQQPSPLTVFQHYLYSNILPTDAENIPYVGNWKYWYRKKGMQTSSDDVLLAFIGSLHYYDTDVHLVDILNDPEKCIPLLERNDREVCKYIDMGCGIGSTLLLTCHKLQPTIFSIGFEAQEESARLIQQSIHGIKSAATAVSSQLPPPSDSTITSPSSSSSMYVTKIPPLAAFQCDIRSLIPTAVLTNSTTISSLLSVTESIYHSCDLITANPPYLPANVTQSICKDLQRRSARFEFAGGVEEYCQAASSLLHPSRGRFILSFWAKDSHRVLKAAQSAGLVVKTQIDVLMGAKPILTSSTMTTTTVPAITTTTNPSSVLSYALLIEGVTTASTDKPYLSIFEMVLPTYCPHNNNSISDDESVDLRPITMTVNDDTKYLTLDLHFEPNKQAVNKRYKLIQQWLHMHPRPLKPRKTASAITSSSSTLTTT